MDAPLILLESSDTRNSITLAICSGLTHFEKSASGKLRLLSGVSIMLGPLASLDVISDVAIYGSYRTLTAEEVSSEIIDLQQLAQLDITTFFLKFEYDIQSKEE